MEPGTNHQIPIGLVARGIAHRAASGRTAGGVTEFPLWYSAGNMVGGIVQTNVHPLLMMLSVMLKGLSTRALSNL